MSYKVCIVIPDSTFLIESRTMPFLGPLYVAASLEANGHSVDVIDLSSVSNWEDVISDYFESNKNENIQVGIGGTSPQQPMAYKIARFIKQRYNKKIILGGTHVSLAYSAYKLEKSKGINGRATREIQNLQKDFDVLVCGEAELAIFDALELEKGIIDADDKHSKYFLRDLKVAPIPARHLIDLNSYKYSIDGNPASTFIGNRGCYFRCAFCAGRHTSFLRFVRSHPLDIIKQEIEYLYKEHSITGFMDFSDEINIPKNFIGYTNALREVQDKLGVEFRFRGFVKAELFTEEQAKAMYEAGFRIILSGFESGDERILQNIKKNATVDDNKRVIEICQKYNLKSKALMSINHCGESHQTVENTKKFLLENKPDFFDLTCITPFFGSPYFDLAVQDDTDPNIWVYSDDRNGDKLFQKEVDYTSETFAYKGIPGSYISSCWTEHLSAEEVVKLRDEVEDEVRKKLNIPYDTGNPARKYEHSMGSSRNMPDWILRSTDTHPAPQLDTQQKDTTIFTDTKKKSLKVI